MYLNYSIQIQKYLLSYINSARFQLENCNAPARLDSAQNPFSLARLSSGNFSSKSSLVVRFSLILLEEFLCEQGVGKWSIINGENIVNVVC